MCTKWWGEPRGRGGGRVGAAPCSEQGRGPKRLCPCRRRPEGGRSLPGIPSSPWSGGEAQGKWVPSWAFSTEHNLAVTVSIPGTGLGTAPEAEQRLGNAPGFGKQDGTAGRGDMASTRLPKHRQKSARGQVLAAALA